MEFNVASLSSATKVAFLCGPKFISPDVGMWSTKPRSRNIQGGIFPSRFIIRSNNLLSIDDFWLGRLGVYYYQLYITKLISISFNVILGWNAQCVRLFPLLSIYFGLSTTNFLESFYSFIILLFWYNNATYFTSCKVINEQDLHFKQCHPLISLKKEVDKTNDNYL